MLTTTLNKIAAHAPCTSGWRKLLTSLGKTKADDARLSLLTIHKSNGLNNALWCLRAVDNVDFFARRFALDCARSVEHLSDDPRIKACNDVTERFLKGKATKDEMAAARAAQAASWAPWAAARAARDATWDAAWAAARAAPWDAAENAPRAATRAAQAAPWATRDAPWDARDAIGKHFVACLKAWPKGKWPKMKKPGGK